MFAHLDAVVYLLLEDIRVILVKDLYILKGYLYWSDIPTKAFALVFVPIWQQKVIFVWEVVHSLQILVPLLDILLALSLKSDLDEVFGFVEDEVWEFLMVDFDLIFIFWCLLFFLIVVTHGYMFENWLPKPTNKSQ